MKTLLKQLALLATIGISTTALAEEQNSTDSALNQFNQRTFVTIDDEVNYAANVQDLVGQFIIITKKGGVILLGDHAVSDAASNVVKLNQRTVFHKLYDKNWSFSGAIASFLNFKLSDDSLAEVSITDLVSVTNKDVTASNCTSKKPTLLTGDYSYYCISAVTLSQIATRQYKKTDKLATGSIAVVTANGNYQLQNGTEGLQLAINISKVGPFRNKGIFDPEKALQTSLFLGTLLTNTAGVDNTKSISGAFLPVGFIKK